jgi:predicted extracellular nuclease
LELTIREVRDPSNPKHPAPKTTRVRIRDVYVTGVKTKNPSNSNPPNYGFFVQSDTGPFGGIFINTGTTVPVVQVGNRVDVIGLYDELFSAPSVSHLTGATFTIVDAGTTLPFGPVVIDPAVYSVRNDPTAESYEFMLCQVDAPSVTVMNSDGAQDFDEFTITGGLRVDDDLFDTLDNNFAVGTSFPKVVGICGYSFNNRKIWPRSQADLE